MSLTLICWLAAFVLLLVASFRRPVWGIGTYLITFFAMPSYWWWGRGTAIYGLRWNLYGGIGLLLAALLGGVKLLSSDPTGRRMDKLALWILCNAMVIHLAFASDEFSLDPFVLVAKFVLLFFLVSAVIQTRDDLKIAILCLALGAGYWGFEATVNDRGRFAEGRLEGFGGPGAESSNSLASCVATILPLAGGMLFLGRKWEKILVGLLCALMLNVVLLCNSRGTFLSLIAGAMMLVAIARGRVRRNALVGLLLGACAAFFMLRDPQIISRFMTTFAAEEERDASAASRLVFWEAGAAMIADNPLGRAGNAFKIGGTPYLAALGWPEANRSVHNGYINEACEWGIQGLLLRLAFMSVALLAVYKAIVVQCQQSEFGSAFYGACIIAGATAFLGTCMFGDFLDNEWGYWIAALSKAYSRLYGEASIKEPVLHSELLETG